MLVQISADELSFLASALPGPGTMKEDPPCRLGGDCGPGRERLFVESGLESRRAEWSRRKCRVESTRASERDFRAEADAESCSAAAAFCWTTASRPEIALVTSAMAACCSRSSVTIVATERLARRTSSMRLWMIESELWAHVAPSLASFTIVAAVA